MTSVPCRAWPSRGRCVHIRLTDAILAAPRIICLACNQASWCLSFLSIHGRPTMAFLSTSVHLRWPCGPGRACVLVLCLVRVPTGDVSVVGVLHVACPRNAPLSAIYPLWSYETCKQHCWTSRLHVFTCMCMLVCSLLNSE